MTAHLAILAAALAASLALPRVGAAQEIRRASPLRVGAAKVDVTPKQAELPKSYLGVLDHVFARAIVLESGADRAALITVDAGMIQDGTWQAVTRQIETDLRIPA